MSIRSSATAVLVIMPLFIDYTGNPAELFAQNDSQIVYADVHQFLVGVFFYHVDLTPDRLS